MLLPEQRLVAELVAQLCRLDASWVCQRTRRGQVAEQRLVDDLDTVEMRWPCLVNATAHFVGRQKAGVDQGIEDASRQRGLDPRG